MTTTIVVHHVTWVVLFTRAALPGQRACLSHVTLRVCVSRRTDAARRVRKELLRRNRTTHRGLPAQVRHELGMAGTPRSRMDGDGTMRWRCSQCTVYRLESEMEWGLGGQEEWPPWRVVCKRCSAALPTLSPPSAAKHSARGSSLSPRRTLSPRRLVPLATARADLNARTACNRATGCGGSLAAASILRPPAPRRSRDPKRHALVSRFCDDGPKPRAAPGVISRLQALSTTQHSKRCTSDADEEEDEPPPGGYHPRVFFEPKLERSMLKDLLSQTTMSRSELYRLFNRFKALCQVLVRVRARARVSVGIGVKGWGGGGG